MNADTPMIKNYAYIEFEGTVEGALAELHTTRPWYEPPFVVVLGDKVFIPADYIGTEEKTL